MKPMPQRNPSASPRPSTPPHPAGKASTDEAATNDTAVPINAAPIVPPITMRSQRPAGSFRHSRSATIGAIGNSSKTVQPNRVKARSANHAPGRPSQFSAGPPAAVFSDGSPE